MRLLKKIKLFSKWVFTDEKTTVAIDITSSCNLKCVHCYWWKEKHPQELSDEEMIAFMKRLRGEGFVAAFLYGGEPLLRPRICEAASNIFDFTLIFTNGTLGFPDISCQWILSLDGTKEINDRIRGAGVYQTVIDNLLKASRKPIVHITINQLNKNHINEFLQAMHRQEIKQKIRGVGFSFYTPNRGLEEQALFIPLAERDRLVDELLAYRKKHRFIMGFTGKMAHYLKQNGGFSEWNSLDKCPVSKLFVCYRADGSIKPCTYGINADCSRCGCASVTTYLAAIKAWDPESLIILNLLTNGCM